MAVQVWFNPVQIMKEILQIHFVFSARRIDAMQMHRASGVNTTGLFYDAAFSKG